MRTEYHFEVEHNSRLEPVFVERVVEPLLELVPEWVSPNVISAFAHACFWVAALSAMLAWRLHPAGRTTALVVAAVATVLGATADCLDGMQARRIGSNGPMGELVDHGLDSVAVGLTAVGLSYALQLPPWAVVAALVSAVAPYHAQLVLYHHTGRFVHPSTSGTVALLGTSVLYLFAALVFLVVGRAHPWAVHGVLIVVLLSTIEAARILVFYYRRMGRLVAWHLPFLLLLAGFASLYLGGVIGTAAFLFVTCLVSLRTSGGIVLHTVVRERFSGMDWGAAAFVVAIYAVHRFGPDWTMRGLSPAQLTCAAAGCYLLARTGYDLLRHWSRVREVDADAHQAASGA